MSTLHIINSAKTPDEFKRLTRYFGKGDSVIFIQDGCYNLIADIQNATLKFYALDADMHARAVSSEYCEAVDYPQFVTLTLNCNNTISW